MNTSTHARENALITGASRGIGLELAKQFARHGFDLVLVARDVDRLAAVAAELQRDFGVTVRTIAADLSTADAPRAIVEQLDKQACNINVLVNNAGIASYGNFADTDLTRELRMMQINMLSLVHLSKLLLPQMLARRSGRIVNVSSLGGYQPGGPKWSVYMASKSFVLSFSKGLGVELRGSGVSVTALCPGATDTDFKTENHLERTALYRLFAMTPARVARLAYRGIIRRRTVVVPGLFNKILAIAGEFPPRRIALEVNGLLMR
ncbi:MAG: SDR family oxidoreductase [Gallionella sp.]